MKPAFLDLVDLASERLGAVVVAANDEFFAPKENLIRHNGPIWREGEHTERGKWMDGWETRRRRDPGDDWCIIRLGAAGIARGVDVDTTHFKGNYPEACAIEACDPSGAVNVSAREQRPPIGRAATSSTNTPRAFTRHSAWIGPWRNPTAPAAAVTASAMHIRVVGVSCDGVM